MPCLFPMEMEANKERKPPSFVRSLMSCNCDKIQTFLNEKIRSCLPETLPNGKFVFNEEESEANQVMEKIEVALFPLKPNEGFNVEPYVEEDEGHRETSKCHVLVHEQEHIGGDPSSPAHVDWSASRRSSGSGAREWRGG